MQSEPTKKQNNAGETWLAAIYISLFLGFVGYREFQRYYFPGEIDPLSHWLFVTYRTWSLIACVVFAVAAVLLEWRRYRIAGKSSLITSFLGLALIVTILIFMFSEANGT